MPTIKHQYVNNNLIQEFWGDVDADVAHALKKALYYYCQANEQLENVARDAKQTADRLLASLSDGYETTVCLMRTAEKLVEYTTRRQGYCDTASQMLHILQSKEPVEGLKFTDLFADSYQTGGGGL